VFFDSWHAAFAGLTWTGFVCSSVRRHSVLKHGDHYLLIIIERGLKRYLRPWWKFSWT
jgi:hypothetical protein